MALLTKRRALGFSGGVSIEPFVDPLSPYGFDVDGKKYHFQFGLLFRSFIHSLANLLAHSLQLREMRRFSSYNIPNSRTVCLFLQYRSVGLNWFQDIPKRLSDTHPSILCIFPLDLPRNKLYDTQKLMKWREADLRKLSVKPDCGLRHTGA